MSVIQSKIKVKSNSFAFLKSLDLFELVFSKVPKCYRREDAILHGVVGLILFVAVATGLINARFFHFTFLDYPIGFVTAAPGLVVTWIVGMLCYQRHQRMGLFLTSFSQSFLFLMVVGYVLAAVLTTPFAPIDTQLLHFDEFFKFSTLGLMNWVYQHPWLTKCLKFCYDTWFFQLMLTPLVLSLFKDRVETDRYMIATFVSLLIGVLIYYFFPTVAPAGILQNSHFLPMQHDLVARFNDVHQSLPVTKFDGGMIAFPSFHVINCLIVLYAFRRYAFIFLPLLVINIFSISATMLLGFHYLADVLASFVIAYLSVKLTRRALTRRVD